MPNTSQPKNNRLLKVLRRETVDQTPVWLMRQAGRYLPEYRATRARAGSFMNLCKTPELACEVTLQPLRRYELDAAIIFSDILTIPDAMGLGLTVAEGKGPMFSQPIRHENEIAQLTVPDLEHLSYVYKAIELVKIELSDKIPLIGFCGSPWTLAAYMIEGQSCPSFPRAQEMLVARPDLLHKILNILMKSISLHLKAQIRAGVQVIMLFDTWGGLLNTANYIEFSLNYIRQIISELKQDNTYNINNVPIILFTKAGHLWLEQMATTGCDALGVDWEITLNEAKKRVGDKVIIQGNMNPISLLKSPEDIRKEVALILNSFGRGGGHIFNLGHGITPDIPPEHVAVLVDTVHELSPSLHAEAV